jgi:hypothetical protein
MEVTAVITTHARPQHLQEALASVLAERGADFECVIVHEGGAFAIPAESPFEVRVLPGSSSGVAKARNIGLAAARGEFVIFLDDDDVALPHRISNLLEAATRNHADLCYGLTRRVVDHSPLTPLPVPTHLLSEGSVGFCDLLTCNPHINSVLVRTAVLRSIGGFDDGAAHFDDWSAWLRLADRGLTMHCIGEVVAEWRIHELGLTGDVMQARAMKPRLMALFDRLDGELSAEGASAIDIAMQAVSASDIVTYDDYVEVIAESRAALHAQGRCLGPRLTAHAMRF